jgi:hypothetical protein
LPFLILSFLHLLTCVYIVCATSPLSIHSPKGIILYTVTSSFWPEDLPLALLCNSAGGWSLLFFFYFKISLFSPLFFKSICIEFTSWQFILFFSFLFFLLLKRFSLYIPSWPQTHNPFTSDSSGLRL